MRLSAAVCQFAVDSEPEKNARTIEDFASAAARAGTRLLVCPESALVRMPDPDDSLIDQAQPLDGPFAQSIAESSARHGVMIVAGTYTPGDRSRVTNTLLVADGGKIVAHYDKLHLYDAFSYTESKKVRPGDSGVVTVEVDGFTVGLATCYDLRFPEMFRALADAGADLAVLPAAWIKGPLKEEHWFTLLRSRAIENTFYVLGSGETGDRAIGRSSAFDPLGLHLMDLGYGPGIGTVSVEKERLEHVRKVNPSLQHRRFVTTLA